VVGSDRRATVLNLYATVLLSFHGLFAVTALGLFLEFQLLFVIDPGEQHRCP
jgi:hypothetical protein